MNKEKEKEKENASPKKQTVLPQSVISYYAKYRNPSAKIKSQVVMGTKFEMDDRYEVIDTIGQGAYGVVVAAKDKQAKDPENDLVAIKKIEKAFEHKVFTKRTLRELKMLRLLAHENVIGITTLLLPRSREGFDEIYVVSELMESDLASIIKSPQPLSNEHCQYFLYQILRGMKYIHSAQILHRDLKPRNLLVNSNCDLKICDFGLARAFIPEFQIKTGIMTDYVATRWYRAPELLLSYKEYGPTVDIWSIGCLFAELLRRKPFLPGADTKNQIELIFEVIGTPSEEEIATIPREKSRKLVKSLPKRKGKSFESIFPKATPNALDLLRKFLIFDPAKRITLEEALKHPFLQELHCPDDEPICKSIPKMEFEFEKYNLNLQQLKDMIYEEILLYHYPDFKKDYISKVEKGETITQHIFKNENSKVYDKTDDYDEYANSDDDFN